MEMLSARDCLFGALTKASRRRRYVTDLICSGPSIRDAGRARSSPNLMLYSSGSSALMTLLLDTQLFTARREPALTNRYSDIHFLLHI
ncbi:hypothetical protein EVAR_45023_1 [Eumeta japonica]|uniref:Uncharacterized protein n=1 Tax=Eumeta variegata TaxID=151549 RepID=A0A4C1XDM8_EUMVA|nr:hypothetical protein EVAR_45023_1 [Eumeta japonica]